MNNLSYFIRVGIFKLYTHFSKRRVAILRDTQAGYSFVYKDSKNTDISVKNVCSDDFSFVDPNAVKVEDGVFENSISQSSKVIVVDLKSLFKNKTLTATEKHAVMNSFIDPSYDRFAII